MIANMDEGAADQGHPITATVAANGGSTDHQCAQQFQQDVHNAVMAGIGRLHRYCCGSIYFSTGLRGLPGGRATRVILVEYRFDQPLIPRGSRRSRRPPSRPASRSSTVAGDVARRQAYSLAGHAIACDFFTEDGKEGVDAFLGKRAPVWKNRR